MKVVTVKFGPEEFESLQAEADRLQLSVTQLIRTYHYQPVITLDDQIHSARQKKETEFFNTQKATYEH